MQTSISGRRIWIMAAVAALPVVAIAAYIAGGALEHSARSRDAAAAGQKYSAVESQFIAVQSANALLTANVWAYRAVAALDDRNFGMANDAEANVVAGLNGIDAEASGINGAALKAVQTESAGVKVYLATNLESERSQLLHLAADITALAPSKSGKAG